MEETFEDMFEKTSEGGSIIKVVGVGGGGCNAVNHMYKMGIKDVSFVVCNTDAQALNKSPVPVKIQLGKRSTEGLGAGSDPSVGRKAAEESLNDVTAMLRKHTKMVFITAGMGGGTGTGATPVIAQAAKNMGILTVAIVTIPFKCIEPDRIPVAIEGIRELQRYVDSLLVINNEKLLDLYGSLQVSEAFAKADDILCTSAKGIAEIITQTGIVNVDFADVCTAMQDSGIVLMGTGRAQGENRVEIAIEQAINSPLLYNNSIRGAKHVLVNIMSGKNELRLAEMTSITKRVMEEIGNKVHAKTGYGIHPSLADDEVIVSLIATGFSINDINEEEIEKGMPKSHVETPKAPVNKNIVITDEVESAGFPDNFEFNPGKDHIYSDVPAASIKVAQKGRMPLWLDDSIPIDVKETIHRPKSHRSIQESEPVLFTIGKDNCIGKSPALYINNQPD